MNMAFILLFILSLSSCSCPNYDWVKPGASDQELKKDAYECNRDALMLKLPIAEQEALCAFYEECMESKGWRQKK